MDALFGLFQVLIDTGIKAVKILNPVPPDYGSFANLA